MTVFCNVDQPNHMLVGGVSVNGLCQQGRLFALSVNRHPVIKNLIAISRGQNINKIAISRPKKALHLHA